MLKLDLIVGEGADIDNGRVVVRVERKTGEGVVRLSFDANKDVPIRVLPTPDGTVNPFRRVGSTP
jgi:hypothetical protein